MRKVEETEDYIHVPVRSASDFVQDSFRTIDISKSQGIKAVIGKLKSDPQGSTHVQKYLFAKSEGWTVDSATEWVEEHKEEDKSMSKKKLINKVREKIASTVRYKGYPMNEKLHSDTGELLVPGYFTDDQQDQVGDIITQAATAKAVNRWRTWGNIRTMHDYPSGRVVKIGIEDGLKWNEIITRPVESKTVELLEGGVLQAYSVGIIPLEWELNEAALPEDEADYDFWMWFFPPIIIHDYDMVEISYVDIPANPRAIFAEIEMEENAMELITNRAFAPKGKSAVIFKALGKSPLYKELESKLIREEWSTAYINDLPSAAFAAVEPAYSESCKGESGECTEDKNARHLPHHNDSVKSSTENSSIDLDHYRNALARANQIKPITESISTDALRSKASNHLEEHRSVLETEDGLDPILFMDDEAWEKFLGLLGDEQPTLERWLGFQKIYDKREVDMKEKEKEVIIEEECKAMGEEEIVEEETPPDPLHELMLGLTEAVNSLTETLNTRFDNIELMLTPEQQEDEPVVEEEPVEDFPVHTQKVVKDEEPEEAKDLTAEDVGEMIDNAVLQSEERVTKIIAAKLAELAKPRERKAIIKVEVPEEEGDEEDEVDVRALNRTERKKRLKEILDGHFSGR